MPSGDTERAGEAGRAGNEPSRGHRPDGDSKKSTRSSPVPSRHLLQAPAAGGRGVGLAGTGIAEPKGQREPILLPHPPRFPSPSFPGPDLSRVSSADIKITPRPPTWEIDSFTSHPAPALNIPIYICGRVCAASLHRLLHSPWVAVPGPPPAPPSHPQAAPGAPSGAPDAPPRAGR